MRVALVTALVATLEAVLAAAPWALTASVVQVTAPATAPEQQIGVRWSLQRLPVAARPSLRQRLRLPYGDVGGVGGA
jgi:hypothetical protein